MSLRFDDGQRLLGSRSPHVCQGNILLTDNIHVPEVNQYMNLTEEIVCINSIGENILQRLSGCDYHKGRLRSRGRSKNSVNPEIWGV